jgi:hypothetical protein
MVPWGHKIFTICSGAVGGKTGKTSFLPRFSKIECGGGGSGGRRATLVVVTSRRAGGAAVSNMGCQVSK